MGTFLYELDDAREHLQNLISELAEDGSYDEANLSVDLGHVYAQLNRAWRRRPVAGSIGCSMALVKRVSQ
jgi:hypothetical protein